jgi:hypothetical protein
MINLRIYRGDTTCLIGQHYRRSRNTTQDYIVYESLMNELGEEELYLEFGPLPMLVLTPTMCLPPDRTTWQRDEP